MKLERQTEVINRLGLHARASAKLVKSAGRYASSIRIGTDSETVDGKSIMGLMMLAATQGTTMTITIEGEDAESAMHDIIGLFEDRFDEHE
ncbi:MAG TPA: HPr family phosphocarrier protein [Gammaproteobacteria bacterium]|jgi:phosphocarrier protein|nr:HPr family phosphocarrier protein [Gammaproteobacteria bacterium]HAU11143.1 HPr family phosphocarrier protein [Gammaproteobacteria bacterium]HIA87683.1 HPr family phosphocarrier protein [Gammaproteobacteria bacterium]HIN58908.1 HPr family phosphocarrier protein [Gammaproteobacteria bacterium]|tara:strand:- start:451 stop:723 length:273 start_codon:yes stop_codon:yes gene_type:complete